MFKSDSSTVELVFDFTQRSLWMIQKEQFVKHTGPIVIAALAMIGPSKNAKAE